MHFERVLQRMRGVVSLHLRQRERIADGLRSTATSPSGVANARTEGNGESADGTRCVGPNSTTRRIVSRAAASRAYAAAAIGPE